MQILVRQHIVPLQGISTDVTNCKMKTLSSTKRYHFDFIPLHRYQEREGLISATNYSVSCQIYLANKDVSPQTNSEEILAHFVMMKRYRFVVTFIPIPNSTKELILITTGGPQFQSMVQSHTISKVKLAHLIVTIKYLPSYIISYIIILLNCSYAKRVAAYLTLELHLSKVCW